MEPEQIKKTAQEAVLTLINTLESTKQVNREDTPNWFPIQYQSEYNKTDLVYDPFCLGLFARIEALKREKFSIETMRQWFIEFVRKGWTKKMLQRRYDALLDTKIYGIEKLEIADWVNAVPVMAMDEVNLLVKQTIDSTIQRGSFIKNRVVELNDEEKKTVELSVANQLKFEHQRKRSELMETTAKELKKTYRQTLNEKKKKLLDMDIEDRMKIVDKLYDTGRFGGDRNSFGYNVVLLNLEEYADLIPDDWLNQRGN